MEVTSLDNRKITFGRAFIGAPIPTSPAAGLLRTTAIGRPGEHLLRVPRRVFDQSDINCCVSCAIASGMEILNSSWPNLAPLFHYYVARFETSGAADAEGNLYLDGGLSVATSHGICRDQEHKVDFTRSGSDSPPSFSAFGDARQRKLRRRGRFPGYSSISGGSRYNSIKKLIKAGKPVLLGLTLPRSYPDNFLNSAGRWLDPETPGDNVYRHCVLVTGYSDAKTALRVLDSQGDTKFKNGSWWIGSRVVDSSLVEEAYSLPL